VFSEIFQFKVAKQQSLTNLANKSKGSPPSLLDENQR
jgi:hypothetical protein